MYDNKDRKKVWKVTYTKSIGFKHIFFVYGTEAELHDYLITKVGAIEHYEACNNREVQAIEELGHKIYIAPKLNEG